MKSSVRALLFCKEFVGYVYFILTIKIRQMKDYLKSVLLQIWCGFLISLGFIAYLIVGSTIHPLIGAILFAFGLISIVCTGQLNLYTGWVGYCDFRNVHDWVKLISMLVFNVLGSILGLFLFAAASFDDFLSISIILEYRANLPLHSILVRSILTGIIMHVCVWSARKKSTYIPILLGVPLFILCGLPHCIADAFYYPMSAVCFEDISILVPWLISIVGNTIGCNLPRIYNDELGK